jgi:hypothetical protein
MNFNFMAAVKRKYYIVAASLPAEDYPPANIASFIKQCESLNRSDLADQIKMQWSKVLNKYPETRRNWATAVVIGGNSIKKNIFGGKEFVVWLKEQEELTTAQKNAAKAIPTIMQPPKGAPAIAIPKKDETPEEWAEEAAKTKEGLLAAKKAFTTVNDYIVYLEKEATDLKKKIGTYGPGGEKSTTKTGTPSKYADRVPKWQAVLKTTMEQIDETKKNFKEIEAEFKAAANNYNNAPITTVAFEKKAAAGVENILEVILNMKDLDKQRDLLSKLNDSLEKQKATGAVEAAAGDKVIALFKNFIEGLKNLKSWFLGLKKSVDAFGKLASIRY